MKSITLFILALVILVGVLFWPTEPEHNVMTISKSPSGGDFTLYSSEGAVKLSDLHGKVVILYFGYTWCPDICPTSLSLLSAALHELEPQELALVRPMFISVDPQRDTPSRLKDYAKYFHPSIIGITGSEEEIASVAKLYGVGYQKVVQDSATNYTVDHTSETYVIGKDGKLIERLAHGSPASVIVKSIRTYLKP